MLPIKEQLENIKRDLDKDQGDFIGLAKRTLRNNGTSFEIPIPYPRTDGYYRTALAICDKGIIAIGFDYNPGNCNISYKSFTSPTVSVSLTSNKQKIKFNFGTTVYGGLHVLFFC